MKSCGFEKPRTLFVIGFCVFFIVLRAIQFNDQLCLMAVEIYDVTADGFLALEAGRIMSQKSIPQQCFVLCHGSAHRLSARNHAFIILKRHMITRRFDIYLFANESPVPLYKPDFSYMPLLFLPLAPSVSFADSSLPEGASNTSLPCTSAYQQLNAPLTRILSVYPPAYAHPKLPPGGSWLAAGETEGAIGRSRFCLRNTSPLYSTKAPAVTKKDETF